MADPFTLAAVGSTVLSEGVKFLFEQAGELLKARRDRKTASRSSPQPQTVALVLPAALGGQRLEAQPDYAALEDAQADLTALRGALLQYVDGAELKLDDRATLQSVEDLRSLLEGVYGLHLTFSGEDRPPSGSPVVSGAVRVGELRGKATGVEIDEMTEGNVRGTGNADSVEAGAELKGVRIGSLGRPKRRSGRP